MKDLLEKVGNHVRIEEGPAAIEEFLLNVYFHEGTSTAELARKMLLPVPVVVAIKKEFIKAGAVSQDKGVRLTPDGRKYIENNMGYARMDRRLYSRLLQDPTFADPAVQELLQALDEVLANRPSADVTIDQSRATPLTGLKRAVLCLQNQCLIGKRILCVGDDDLISVAITLLLKHLFPDAIKPPVEVDVLDIDKRFISSIEQIALSEGLPIRCHQVDLRQPLPSELQQQYDCFFTDPPYTLPGMNLFLSRGLTGLKTKVGIPVFLSFSHKSPDFALEMQQSFASMGLVVSRIEPRFNEYEGANIHANSGQMIVLKTTSRSQPIITEAYTEGIYTGELRRTVRTYTCKTCGQITRVGYGETIITVEELKELGCPACGQAIFDLTTRAVLQPEGDKE